MDPAFIDLNTLLPSDSPYYLVLALGINDAGEIVGMAIDQNTGDAHAYLATPRDSISGDVKLSRFSERRWSIPQNARGPFEPTSVQSATRAR